MNEQITYGNTDKKSVILSKVAIFISFLALFVSIFTVVYSGILNQIVKDDEESQQITEKVVVTEVPIPTIAEVACPNNAIVYWDFEDQIANECSKYTPTQSSVSNNYSEGVLSGKALSLDGSYNISGLPSVTQGTVAFWIKIHEYQSIENNLASVISVWPDGTDVRFDVRVRGDANEEEKGKIVSFQGKTMVNVDTVLNINEWAHIVIAKEEKNISVYRDGEKIGTYEYYSGTKEGDNTNGSVGGYSDHFVKASIDELFIFETILTEDEIKELYSGAYLK